jgi:hypothetical protein
MAQPLSAYNSLNQIYSNNKLQLQNCSAAEKMTLDGFFKFTNRILGKEGIAEDVTKAFDKIQAENRTIYSPLCNAFSENIKANVGLFASAPPNSAADINKLFGKILAEASIKKLPQMYQETLADIQKRLEPTGAKLEAIEEGIEKESDEIEKLPPTPSNTPALPEENPTDMKIDDRWKEKDKK